MKREIINFVDWKINSEAICYLEIITSSHLLSMSTVENQFDYGGEFASREQAEEKIKELIPEKMFKEEIIVFSNYYIFKDKISFFDIYKDQTDEQGEYFVGRVCVVNGDQLEEDFDDEKQAFAWLESILKLVGDKEQVFFFDLVYSFKNKVAHIRTEYRPPTIIIDIFGGVQLSENYQNQEALDEKMKTLIQEITA